jgi:hypothetical protein
VTPTPSPAAPDLPFPPYTRRTPSPSPFFSTFFPPSFNLHFVCSVNLREYILSKLVVVFINDIRSKINRSDIRSLIELSMSSNRLNRKAVPQLSSPSSDSMFYNYSPSMSFSNHQSTIRSPLAEDTDVRSPDFVWEAEYQDKMTVLKNSISQVPSTEKRQINFHFIDDMKATFDLKSLHSKRKRPTAKQVAADNKAASRKERKGALKQLPEPSKKRRPRNAFILYRTVLQAKAEFKGKTQTELSRLIAACWQNEPPETRAHFERAAELEKGMSILALMNGY